MNDLGGRLKRIRDHTTAGEFDGGGRDAVRLGEQDRARQWRCAVKRGEPPQQARVGRRPAVMWYRPTQRQSSRR
jgi:hypothetical protein